MTLWNLYWNVETFPFATSFCVRTDYRFLHSRERDVADISKDLFLLSTLNQDASTGTLHPLKLSIQFMAAYRQPLILSLASQIFEFICKIVYFINTAMSPN